MEKTKKIVPAIVHEDNTCRIQTVNKNQNKNLLSQSSQQEVLSGIGK